MSKLRRDEIRRRLDEVFPLARQGPRRRVKAGMIMYYVYCLKCSDNKTYVGCAEDLKDRIDRHQKGNIPATKERFPIKLVSYFAFSNKYTAFTFEQYLKSGSGRVFLKKHDIIM